MSLFVGIELQHAWRLYTWAAVDSHLKLLALRQGRLPDVLTYLAELGSPLVAINSPSSLNQGRLKREENRHGLFSELPGNHSGDLRQVEYELLAKGYPIPRTPAMLTACPAWMRRGFRLYQELKDNGYSPHDETSSERHFLETSSEAVYKNLLAGGAFPAETIQGRIQRQLVLWENRLPLRDPMVFFEEVTRHKLLRGFLPDQDILPLAQLNALAAAFVAYLAGTHPDRIARFGEAEEGFLYLPTSNKPEPA